MPVHVEKRGGKFRLIEPSGRIAKTGKSAKDGGGHASKAAASRQARAVNSGLSKGRKR